MRQLVHDPSELYLTDISVTSATSVVPEPSSFLLFGTGLTALISLKRKFV
jgi:hypothetical protein